MEIGIHFGPVTNGLRNSPTGSKDREVLATTLVIASTGAMLIVGHEAPCRLSALACRSEAPNHTGKVGNSRQVSGTSDASKTQLGLIGHLDLKTRLASQFSGRIVSVIACLRQSSSRTFFTGDSFISGSNLPSRPADTA